MASPGRINHRIVGPFATALFVSALIMAGCSSSDGSSGSTTTETPSSESGTGANDADADPSSIPGDAADSSDGGGGSGEMTIETDTGQSWTLEQSTCAYTPDNDGPFAELWSAEGTLSTGGELIVLEAMPPDPSSSDGPVLIGTFVDEANDIAYVAIEGSAVSDGSTMTLTLGMHDSPNKIVGDPIDLTATVTCSL